MLSIGVAVVITAGGIRFALQPVLWPGNFARGAIADIGLFSAGALSSFRLWLAVYATLLVWCLLAEGFRALWVRFRRNRPSPGITLGKIDHPYTPRKHDGGPGMVFFYFLPMLVAIAFLLARVSRGGSMTVRPGGAPVLIGLLAIVALGLIGALFAGMLH